MRRMVLYTQEMQGVRSTTPSSSKGGAREPGAERSRSRTRSRPASAGRRRSSPAFAAIDAAVSDVPGVPSPRVPKMHHGTEFATQHYTDGHAASTVQWNGSAIPAVSRSPQDAHEQRTFSRASQRSQGLSHAIAKSAQIVPQREHSKVLCCGSMLTGCH